MFQLHSNSRWRPSTTKVKSLMLIYSQASECGRIERLSSAAERFFTRCNRISGAPSIWLKYEFFATRKCELSTITPAPGSCQIECWRIADGERQNTPKCVMLWWLNEWTCTGPNVKHLTLDRTYFPFSSWTFTLHVRHVAPMNDEPIREKQYFLLIIILVETQLRNCEISHSSKHRFPWLWMDPIRWNSIVGRYTTPTNSPNSFIRVYRFFIAGSWRRRVTRDGWITMDQ